MISMTLIDIIWNIKALRSYKLQKHIDFLDAQIGLKMYPVGRSDITFYHILFLISQKHHDQPTLSMYYL